VHPGLALRVAALVDLVQTLPLLPAQLHPLDRLLLVPDLRLELSSEGVPEGGGRGGQVGLKAALGEFQIRPVVLEVALIQLTLLLVLLALHQEQVFLGEGRDFLIQFLGGVDLGSEGTLPQLLLETRLDFHL
jgi:hypothetical protein